MGNKEIALDIKRKVFNAAIEGIALYGSELWGMESFPSLEGIQTYFFKRVYGMPHFTPGYMITTETGTQPLLLKTIKRRGNYIKKTMAEENKSKLTYIVTTELNRLNIGTNKECKEMATRNDLEISNEDIDTYQELMKIVINRERRRKREEDYRKARQSGNRLVYPCLEYEPHYIKRTDMNTQELGKIWKIRADLMKGFWIPYIDNMESCDRCGRKVRPDAFHVLGQCEGEREIRKNIIGERVCSLKKYRYLLNYEPEKILRIYNKLVKS